MESTADGLSVRGDPVTWSANLTSWHLALDTYVSPVGAQSNFTAPPEPEPQPVPIVLLSLRGLEGALAVAGNLLTFVAILRFRRLRTISNVFIANLAVVDILAGLSAVVYISIHLQISDQAWIILCHTLNVMKTFSDSGVLKAILLIGLERFIYINYPMSYYRCFTSSRVILALVIAWMIALGMYIMRLSFILKDSTMVRENKCVVWNMLPWEATMTNCAIVWLQIVLLIVFYSFIFNLARRKIHQGSPGAAEAHGTKHFRGGLRVLRMAFTVLGVFTVLTVPGLIIVMLTAKNVTTPTDYPALKAAVSLMWYLNSAVNPAIYAWQSRDFRRAFGTLLRVEAKPMGYHSNGSTQPAGSI